MPTIRDSAERADLVRRLRRVMPTTAPAWGTFSAPRMVCHLSDQVRVALGEISSRDASTAVGRTLVKWSVIRTSFQAPPGRVKTAREMLTTSPAE